MCRSIIDYTVVVCIMLKGIQTERIRELNEVSGEAGDFLR